MTLRGLFMILRCPHCGERIPAHDTSGTDIAETVCKNCGTRFEVRIKEGKVREYKPS